MRIYILPHLLLVFWFVLYEERQDVVHVIKLEVISINTFLNLLVSKLSYLSLIIISQVQHR